MSQEESHNHFVEIRARTDSIASAIFLISGGALSLSIGLLLDIHTDRHLAACTIKQIVSSWHWLLASVIIFIILKCHLVVQSFMLHSNVVFYDKHINKSNVAGFLFGGLGVAAFICGIVKLVGAAITVLSS